MGPLKRPRITWLGHEFDDPEPRPRVTLSGPELDCVSRTAKEKLRIRLQQELPSDCADKWGPCVINVWYQGGIDMVLSLPFQEAIWCVPFERDEFLLSYGDTIINLLGDFHAPYIVEAYRNGYSIYGAGPLPYIVEAYRNGYSIYGAGPLSEICADHLFYEWPERMFREFDESYGAFMREVRGPGTGVTIPLLINLVLSISEKRHEIPQILVHLREDYAGSRQRT